MGKKKTNKRKKLTDQEKGQKAFRKEIKDVLMNLGFVSVPRINGTDFAYEQRTGELDAIYVYLTIFYK